MNILKYTSILAASLAAALPLGAKQQQKSNVYNDGDRACMVGDSLTAAGAYTLALMTYYTTRLPDTNLDFRNLGLSGDYCGGILHRMQSDILPNFDKSRSVGVLMVGMNDAKRENFSKKTLEKLGRHALDAKIKYNRGVYEKRLGEIVNLIAPNTRTLVLFTPSIYDQTADIAVENFFGVNDELVEFGKIGAKTAAKIPNVRVVDMNLKMRTVNAELQSKEGKNKTIIGSDRVHPSFPGGFVMLNAWLERFDEPREVSTVEIDAAAQKLDKSFNCDISNLSFKDGAIAFDSLEAALPFPVENAARNLDGYMKFAQNFNREILKISGLQSGEYALEIDGKKVGTYSAKQLADGVNLATNTNTPQYKQAEGVYKKCVEFRTKAANFRGIIMVESSRRNTMDKLDIDGKVAYVKTLFDKTPQSNAFMYKTYKYYVENKKQEAERAAELPLLNAEIYKAAQPKTHAYRLVKTK